MYFRGERYAREYDGERRTLARSGFQGQFAAHALRQLAADRQAQSGTFRCLGRFRLHKGFQDVFLVLGRDPASGVGDGHGQTGSSGIAVRILPESDVQSDLAVIRELDGVSDEVVEYLADPMRIDVQKRDRLDVFLQHHVPAGNGELERRHDVMGQPVQIGQFQRQHDFSRAELGQVEQGLEIRD